jgi:hypothetical protein
MADLQWLHSGGSFNKEPSNDLGAFPSKFEISGEPPGEPNVMNNLFDDVMPEEAQIGMTDYRCFYIWNPSPTTAIENASMTITECPPPCSGVPETGPVVNFGSKLVDDVQIVQINCVGFEMQPDPGGFIIFDTEFGPPFTVYWTDFVQFGVDLQARLNELPWCSAVTVVGANPYTVTFTGEAGHRNVQTMRVIQNDLLIKGVGRYNTVTYFSCDPWNGYGDFQVKTVYPISHYVQPSGDLRIYNPLTGLWDVYPYSGYSGDIFTLTTPLLFNMVGFIGNCPPWGNIDDPQNWQRGTVNSPVTDTTLAVPWGVIEAPIRDKNCQVCIYKQTQGSPINTYAKPIKTDIEVPETTGLDMNAKYIGNLKPNEGFYIWVERITPAGAGPCLQVFFSLRLVATAVNWPLS